MSKSQPSKTTAAAKRTHTVAAKAPSKTKPPAKAAAKAKVPAKGKKPAPAAHPVKVAAKKKPVIRKAAPASKKPTPKKSAGTTRKLAASVGKSAVSTGKAALAKAAKTAKKVANPAAKSAVKAGKTTVNKVVTPAVNKAIKIVKPAAESAAKAVKPVIKETIQTVKAVKPESFTKPVKTATQVVEAVRKIATEVVKPAVKAATELVDSALHGAPKVAPAPAPVRVAVAAPAPAAKGGKKGPAVQIVSEPIAPAKPPVVSAEVPVHAKSGALYYDSHMHTPLCKHAIGEPEEYAQQAIKAGLKGIIFTCHCPMPDGYWPTVRMSDAEFDSYVAIVQRAADAYKGKVDVCLGLESEFYPGHEKWLENLHKRADFHFVLGGLHWQSKDYLARFETGTIENFRRTYFEHLAQSAETGLYDCLAHPDLVKNYHPDSWCFAIVKNTAAGALDRIAKTGVAMEINTSGLNKSYSEMNPGLEMLRMMAERKIPIVIGSDAHKPIRVGEHFVTALNHLTEVGYEQVSYFKRRERIDLKISDVLASIKKAADANA